MVAAAVGVAVVVGLAVVAAVEVVVVVAVAVAVVVGVAVGVVVRVAVVVAVGVSFPSMQRRERPLSEREVQILGVLRHQEEPWVPLWVLAKHTRLTIHQASAAVRELRHRHLIVTEHHGRPQSGRASVFVSLKRGGI